MKRNLAPLPRNPSLCLVLLLLTWFLPPSQLGAATTNYAIWDLGTLGGSRSEARGINNAGEVAGVARSANGDHAFLWRGSTMADLGAGGAFALSDGGHVVMLDAQTGRRVRWQAGAKTALEWLTNATALDAYDVNAAGQVVGYSTTRLQPSGLIVERAVRWNGANPTVLGSGDAEYSRAYGINDSGWVVGQQTTNDRTRVHAYIFAGSGDIHGLPGYTHSTARAVNGSGQVVGYAYNFSATDAAPFFWEAAGGMRLMRSAGYSFAQPLDLNNQGVVVGCAGPGSSAVMWINGGQTNEQLVNLQNTLPAESGWDLDCAYGINDRDEIVGYGKIKGETHAFLLYPTNPPYAPRHRLMGRVRLETHSMHTDVRGTNALQDALIELALITNTPPELLAYASAWTDAAGRFDFLLPTGATHRVSIKLTLRDRHGRFEVYDQSSDTNHPAWLRTSFLEVNADTSADLVLAINPNGDDGSHNETLLRLGSASFLPEVALIDGAWPEGASNAGSGHFSHLAYLHVLLWAPADFAVRRLTQPVPLLHLRSYDPALTGRQFRFSCSGFTVQVAPRRSDFNNPEGEATPYSARHEYGHAVQCASPISGVNHVPSFGTIGNHFGISNAFSSDSWAEGFATWYACAVAQDLGHLFPWRQRFVGQELDLSYPAGIRLDNPRTNGFNMTFGNLGEEFAIAAVLWDVHQRAGLDALWAALRVNEPNLETFEDVYRALTNSPAITIALADLGCAITQTGANPGGLDCLFVERGFYHDANDDGLYDPGERIGCTRWPDLPLDACRSETPPVTGSELLLYAAEAGSGIALADVQLQLATHYNPPLHTNDSTNLWFAAGPPPWDLPVTVPGSPSRLEISARKTGYAASAPLVLESAFFHDHVNPFRAGGVTERLLEHTFVLGLNSVRLTDARATNGLFEFSFLTLTGRNHAIEFTANLTDPQWTLLMSVVGDGSQRPVSVPMTNSAVRFFRVRVQ